MIREFTWKQIEKEYLPRDARVFFLKIYMRRKSKDSLLL